MTERGYSPVPFAEVKLLSPFWRERLEVVLKREARTTGKSALRVDAQDAKFHLGFDIEEVDLFGPEPLEQSDRLF